MVETALWWQGMKATSNTAFLPLLFDTHRYLVLKGGGGSGKSIFAGRKVLERVTTEPGHRWLVCRKVARTLRESCFEQLKNQAYEHYSDSVEFIPRGKCSDMYIRMKNGSEILFAGLDDVEKLKSIYAITGIWIEEASELLENDFDQLDIRLRTEFPHYLQIILSFNPISITHWLKKRFFDFEIKDEEAREKARARTRTHESTYRDNRFLPEKAVRTLEAFRETNPYYYQVYCLGQWGVTGKTIFDGEAISARLAALSAPPRQGLFRFQTEADGLHIHSPELTDEAGGPVRIYREPEPGRPYVIGADTAGEGSDWFVAQVLDNVTGNQVAVLRCQYAEDAFARQLWCLGKLYNDALIGVETNFSTYPVKLLGLMGYRRLFVRQAEDTFTGALRQSFGFQTTAVTRPVILGELVRVLGRRPDGSSGTELVSDETTLQELLTFVRNDKLRAEAEAGAHDDCVMALAIAWYIRPQQTMEVRTETSTRRMKWTEDMWEDWRGASPEERKRLRIIWGEAL